MMGNAWKCALGTALSLGFLAGTASAQFKNGSQPTELNIPRVSQHGTVSQRLGLSDITITYHRPEVGGREIWGKTVPYGKVWRAGANENTAIHFTDDVSVEGKPLAHDPGQGSMDDHFLEKFHFMGQLQLRREGRRSAGER